MLNRLFRPLATLLLAATGVASLSASLPHPLSATALPADAAMGSLPPRVVAPTDKAEFRRFVLDNGIKVLLVSDPNFNKSAASLVVGVGQIDDPFEHAGLAHFLEHMLFLGTEKFPDVEAYSQFITENGGYNNAYTSTDHTNYQFEVRHEALEGAIDRFSQFFIAPLFNPDFTEREVNAVHNEAMRHVQNDVRRMLNVRREIYNPEAGESKFSTGNKDTLANATPEIVRDFYEANYSADHMALAIAGVDSLDELERLARTYFSPIPNRDVPEKVREPIFLPEKDALRIATIEPVKELRQLWMEFVVPSNRPHFASKPDEFLLALINYKGDGGLVAALQDADLATQVGGFQWTRTSGYESLFLSADLTTHGADSIPQVMEMFFAYIEHLRNAPFPADFYADQARIAALQETYEDRGEGASLVTAIANAALFYPLEVAERADIAWGEPDENAYRALLDALRPDNMLVTFQAKGVETDRTEEIYGSAYAYTEKTGADFDRLLNPTGADQFALPTPNPFMPESTELLAERALPLIDEPGLALHYAQDVEFERPQATVKLRFVPVRDVATAETDLLLRFYETCLQDALEEAAGNAADAGVSFSLSAGLEGLDLTVTGFGDSASRFAEYVARHLRDFEITPERFASLSELVRRTLRSYEQTEAYQLAQNRASAALREFYFLPDHSIDQADAVTLSDVRGVAQSFFARGRIEALVHGHLTPTQARAAARNIANAIGAEAAAADELVRRAHVEIAPGETLVDADSIKGANSAYEALYLLSEDTPEARATLTVLAAFMRVPFYSELRTRQQLGYIVGAGGTSSVDQLAAWFIIQSSAYAPDELRRRAEEVIASLPDQLAEASPEQWQTVVEGARSTIGEMPKSIAEKAGALFSRAYAHDGDWDRQADSLKALDTLTQEDAVAALRKMIDPETSRSIVILLNGEPHDASTAAAAFTDREAWKTTRQFK